jgi:hypothetical protein
MVRVEMLKKALEYQSAAEMEKVLKTAGELYEAFAQLRSTLGYPPSLRYPTITLKCWGRTLTAYRP